MEIIASEQIYYVLVMDYILCSFPRAMGSHSQINWDFTYGCSNLFSCHVCDDENVKQKLNLEVSRTGDTGAVKGEEEV